MCADRAAEHNAEMLNVVLVATRIDLADFFLIEHPASPEAMKYEICPKRGCFMSRRFYPSNLDTLKRALGVLLAVLLGQWN